MFLLAKAVELDFKLDRDLISLCKAYNITLNKKIMIIIGASSIIIAFLANRMKRKNIPKDKPFYIIGGNVKNCDLTKKKNTDIVSVICSSKRSCITNSCYSDRNSKIILHGSKISLISKANEERQQEKPDEVDISEKNPSIEQLGTIDATIDCWSKFVDLYEQETRSASDSTFINANEAADFLEKFHNTIFSLKEIRESIETDFRKSKRILPRGSHESDDESECDSFESAQDVVADLRDFDFNLNIQSQIENLSLYKTGMLMFEQNQITYRRLRSDICSCVSDADYLIKLHCIRLAFEHLTSKTETRNWFLTAGIQIFLDLFEVVNKNPSDFKIAFQSLMNYVDEPSNWQSTVEELKTRGLSSFTFYDIVLDYIILDAFEDLDSPPATVTTVLSNKWLSSNFKECAMGSAIWSILKLKRKRLQKIDGFMSHFYTLSEQITPIMAWGFLGPESTLKEFCLFFREQIFTLFADMFSFEKCRFNTVENLAVDINSLIEDRVQAINDKFNSL